MEDKNKKGIKVLLIIWGILSLIGIVVIILCLGEKSYWNYHYNYASDYREEVSYFIIAEKLNLVQKELYEDGSITFTIPSELPFGTKVKINEYDDMIQQDNKVYYKCTYYYDADFGGDTQIDYSLDYYLEINAIDELGNHDPLNIFPRKEAQSLPLSVKNAIIEYFDDTYYRSSGAYYLKDQYCFTQDANRIKKAIVLADFNMDGEQDAAVILEDENRNSFLLVLCYNKDTKQSYIAHTDNRYDLAIISPFKKNEKIFISSEDLVNAPNNGFIYELSDYAKTKYAIIYNPKTLQFEQYDQRPLSEIQKEYEERYEEYDEGEEEETDISENNEIIPDMEWGGNDISLTDLSNNFTFSFKTLKTNGVNRPKIIGIEITNKNTSTSQRIRYEATNWFSNALYNGISYLGKEEEISKELEQYHTFIIADFNFDGLEDFAILRDYFVKESVEKDPLYSFFMQGTDGKFYNCMRLFFCPREINISEKTLVFKALDKPYSYCIYQLNNGTWYLKTDTGEELGFISEEVLFWNNEKH